MARRASTSTKKKIRKTFLVHPDVLRFLDSVAESTGLELSDTLNLLLLAVLQDDLDAVRSHVTAYTSFTYKGRF